MFSEIKTSIEVSQCAHTGDTMSSESYDDFVARGGKVRNLDSDYHGRARKQKHTIRVRPCKKAGFDGVYWNAGKYEDDFMRAHPEIKFKTRYVVRRFDTRLSRGSI